MKRKNETLAFYDRNSAEFAEGTLSADMSDSRLRFSACLPPEGMILDFGCGAGRDAKAFLEDGFRVEAADGSEELCALASAYAGIPVRRMLFSELDACERYDGIWACASILHLPKDELAGVIRRIETALKPGGVLYASFKYGDFEGMRHGRYFTDFTEETLKAFMERFDGLKVFDMWVSRDVRSDRQERQWINILARRG